MYNCRSAPLALAGVLLATAAGAQALGMNGIGRPATPQEIAAWDIDVRPDFKGLPQGAGSVAQGMLLWEAQCASCHGVFGESNTVFAPLAGGTTQADVQSGHVARLLDGGWPGRSTLMKLATLSTLWDTIARAMPWNAPKSLQPDEVYALTAFMLHLGGVVPDDFTLSERNIAQVRMPNRHGMSTDHGLWPGKGMGNGGRPDVNAVACMTRCADEPAIASTLPDHARNDHGNLAEQNRAVGATRGTDTTRAPGTARVALATGAAPATAAPATAAANAATPPSAQALARQLNCMGCHGIDQALVGPSLRAVSKKYAARDDAVDYMTRKIVAGGSGVWGSVPMPPQSVPLPDAKALAQWIAAGARP